MGFIENIIFVKESMYHTEPVLASALKNEKIKYDTRTKDCNRRAYRGCAEDRLRPRNTREHLGFGHDLQG
uniref:Uncharacterized protein n=1 Tax=Prevotella sp. GTC17254 TaxID=3236794 RepID=A0AB33J0Y6_9BACT